MDETQRAIVMPRRDSRWWRLKWWLDDAVTAPYRGYRRLAHIAAWIPVLWRDQDYQESFLVDMVIFKLHRMANCLERHQNHGSWKRHVRDIRIAAARLEHYRDPCAFVPYPEESNRPLNFHQRLEEMGLPQWKQWSRRVHEMEEESWNAGWELIRRKGRGWWD